ncbi:DNA polymerase III subunit gamma/tau [Mechercharimyces sp. CAU 1602]|uniref:DNA polymerase III subunit gamma/tau n=1 Tax=Mechercharimyces sp. CAU 1602 TaxID=2973933 RepID=UPI0021615105|nr:DNA polymerase III subunit gamma/tau [Mechercharimyces sp. CAU 1602]MCS1352744.1 DNA polymerase III subunit gamma/tau [Mechercharimyces sp. CAU 1602]
MVITVAYRALYRVFRSQTFAELVGQEHVTRTLTNALATGHFSHAYLFSGPRGTGKTSAAKIMAKAVNCEQGPAPEPCNQCDSCQKITEGSLMDVVEIDAASNRGVDEIRDLRENVRYAPSEVRYKVYIVDEVHMLTTEAFNALLKTLEEPPGHVVFILATTEPHKLPATIISRCQHFVFRRIAVEQMVKHLRYICAEQEIECAEEALMEVARAADGGMRDALSLLDQVRSFSGDRIDESSVRMVTGAVSQDAVTHLLQAVAKQDAKAALDQMESLIMEGVEAERLLQDLIYACRNYLLTSTRTGDQPDSSWQVLLTAGQWMDKMEQMIHFQEQLKRLHHDRMVLELALLRLCEPPIHADAQVERLEKRIRELEQSVKDLTSGKAEITTPIERATLSDRSAERTVAKSVQIKPNHKQLASLQQDAAPDLLNKVNQRWAEVLNEVKREKITVHAWLMNGEPVAATKDAIVVAFKSKIHRETTEKEANKSIIERFLRDVIGIPRLITVMRKDWDTIEKPSAATGREEDSSATKTSETIDPIEHAVQVFGEEIVEITD